MSQQGTIPPEAQQRIALRKQAKEALQKDLEIKDQLHQEFMDECRLLGFKFAHIAPLNPHEQATVGFLEKHPLHVEALNKQELDADAMALVLGIKRHMSYFEAAAWDVHATMCYVETKGSIRICVALVGTGDHFCRRDGRELAANRMLALRENPGSCVNLVHSWIISKSAPSFNHKTDIQTHLVSAVRAMVRAVAAREDGDTFWAPPEE